ncbi:MAG: CBS domain-containing protein [Thermodesulfobacteriota bacterium]|nr:CBS domain-containing protein [Thermodesulfobacteriota bacterium]
MIKAEDIMEKNVISVFPDTEITKAVEILISNHINGVPVIDKNGAIKGILCQSDLIFQQKELPIPPILTILDGIIPLSSSKNFKKALQKTAAVQVEQAMATDVITVKPDTPITEIAGLMVGKHFHTIPVVKDDKLIGIIGKEDVLKTLMG